MKRYLSTGEIANLFSLNRQTLHFYDKINLFVPEYRDENTYYRKYSFEQVANLSLICYLRELGFSIEKIKIIMNLENVDSVIRQLKNKSEMLKVQYNDILNTDNIIQRKIEFVEKRLNDIDITEVEIKQLNKRLYIHLGEEKVLYKNKNFYFFPTIAFYNYNKELKEHELEFGAYVDSQAKIDKQYKDSIKFIDAQQYLCFYHKGPYKQISDKIISIRQEHKKLRLSFDSICINIVDQFLQKDEKKFITEVQIPILK